MHVDKERFLTDRSYASGWVMYCSLFVLTLLSVFLVAKVVTEVIAWTDDSNEMYPSSTISVTGEGEVIAVPDVATFEFSIQVTGESVQIAQDEATKKANAALDFLKKNGVEEKDIKATGYNAYPRYSYDYCQGGVCTSEQRLVGYDVSSSFTVTVRDTAKAGELLSGIGATGITNVSGLNFTIDDPAKLKEEARSKAIEHAKAQAERLAQDLGVDLEGVINFSEDQGYTPEPYYGAMGGAMDMSVKTATPELPAGENIVKSRVYITYEIE
jgi:uncharacterized protein YggE